MARWQLQLLLSQGEVQEGSSVCAQCDCGPAGAYLLIQLAQLLGQVPALSVAAVDVANPFPLSVAQAK